MATPSARLLTFVSFANSSAPSASSASAAASKTSQRLWRSLAAVVFALSLLLGASVKGQAQTDVQSASPTDSAAPTMNVLPPMSAPGARHFRNDHFKNNAV